MTFQVNNVYDPAYFGAENNEYSNTDNFIWWSSKNRYSLENGAETSEYLEIDLTKRRTINYISFDIIHKPIDVEIQYDSIDLDDLDDYSQTSRWRSVQKIDGELFDSSISYLSEYTNPWKHCEFYFTDFEGNALIARRLRIKFTRRAEDWPANGFAQFPWTVDVKNLRVGRYITKKDHVQNALINTGSLSNETKFPVELRQRFYIKQDFEISASATTDLSNVDSFSPSSILPKVTAFEFLIRPESQDKTASFEWELYRLVGSVERIVDRGTVDKKLLQGIRIPDGDTIQPDTNVHEWIRFDLNAPVQTAVGETYEVRIRNKATDSCKSFYSVSPNPHSAGANLDVDLRLVDSTAVATTKANESAVFRVIADTGNYGKDLLGNEYREGVRYNSASQAIDGKKYSNWTCFPNPSPDGVECLYLDVRKLVNGSYLPSVIDSFEINTLTPGVRMNIYFSRQEISGGGAPQTIDDWESILWTPLRDSFKLNAKQLIDLPYPLCANWVCLEFYNLQAIPLGLTGYPVLPEVEFKEFPQWVYDDYREPLKTNDEPNLMIEKFSSYTVEEVFSPALENKSGLRIYSEKAQTLSENVSANGFGKANATDLAKVSFSQRPFEAPSVRRVDTDTMLGAFVYEDYNNDPNKTYIAEAQQYPRVVNARSVSNINDRRMLARHEETVINFNRVCAHHYAVKKARYNKKAYSVSISEISLFRRDYTVELDDNVIHDVLVYENAEESILIESSTWEPEQKLSIPIGGNVYVTYTVNGTTFEDELITFESVTDDSASYEPVDLIGSGSIATSVIARSAAFKNGETYYRNQDFVIVYDPVLKKNQIKRNDIPARLVVGNVVNSIDKYTANGAAIIGTETDYPNTDIIEIGNPIGVVLSAGVATVSSTLVSTGDIASSINSLAQVYATLTDPTD